MEEKSRIIPEEKFKELYEAACSAAKNSYSPYSHFPVGAALLMEDGTIIKGANIENRSFGLTNCAERSAIFTAMSAGYRSFVALVIVTPASDYPVGPCGACRQVMLEVENRHHHPIRTLLYGTKGIYIIEGGTRELLPLTFDASFLE